MLHKHMVDLPGHSKKRLKDDNFLLRYERKGNSMDHLVCLKSLAINFGHEACLSPSISCSGYELILFLLKNASLLITFKIF